MTRDVLSSCPIHSSIKSYRKIRPCCRVKTFCGFQTLKKGCITIAIVCIVVAIMNILVGRIIFSIPGVPYRKVVYVVAGIQVFMSGLSIVFALMLYTGAREARPKLVNSWIIFTEVYMIFNIITLILVVIYAIVNKDDIARGILHWVLWDGLVTLVTTISLIYCVIVALSYKERVDW